MHTFQQLLDYLNAHGASHQLIDQVRSLQGRHGLNAQTFQDLCNRLRWRPRGLNLGDAVNWVRHGIRG
ncbi:hypothetical protein GCM10010464_87700 [Pseudonocardia yunnanensis]|uniref:Uncharacterized protein n=1 Tax=Pseudonocardia yunnanensis TaxID=58107 RepID=A0ABW4F7E3_9PSEU